MPGVEHAKIVPIDSPRHQKLFPKGGGFIGEEWFFECLPGYVNTGIISTICSGEKGVAKWTIPKHQCIGE